MLRAMRDALRKQMPDAMHERTDGLTDAELPTLREIELTFVTRTGA
jgi:hypothetical protein